MPDIHDNKYKTIFDTKLYSQFSLLKEIKNLQDIKYIETNFIPTVKEKFIRLLENYNTDDYDSVVASFDLKFIYDIFISNAGGCHRYRRRRSRTGTAGFLYFATGFRRYFF